MVVKISRQGLGWVAKQREMERQITPLPLDTHGILSHMPPYETPQLNPRTPKQFKYVSSCNMGLIGGIWEYIPHSFPHSSKTGSRIIPPKNLTHLP